MDDKVTLREQTALRPLQTICSLQTVRTQASHLPLLPPSERGLRQRCFALLCTFQARPPLFVNGRGGGRPVEVRDWHFCTRTGIYGCQLRDAITGVTKKHQKFIFKYWAFSQKSYLNMWRFNKSISAVLKFVICISVKFQSASVI